MRRFTARAFFALPAIRLLLAVLGAIFCLPAALAQPPDEEMPADIVSVADDAPKDQRIEARIESISG